MKFSKEKQQRCYEAIYVLKISLILKNSNNNILIFNKNQILKFKLMTLINYK